MEKIDRIAELLTLASTDELSEAERMELEDWVTADKRHRQLLQEITSSSEFALKYRQYQSIDSVGFQKRLEKSIGLRSRISLRWAFRVAAIALLTLGVGLSLFYLSGRQHQTEQLVSELILPGKAVSMLVLGNGQEILLSPEDTAQIDLQGETFLSREKDCLVYTGAVKKNDEYNTLRVPRGGEFKITLADGTFIHLNAASELRYPVSFSGNSRTVYLSGEAWFAVAKDTTRPFYVQTDHLQIKVYGTSFNVNTQDTNQTTVALVSGEVGIQADQLEEYRLVPSDLACYHYANRTMEVRQTDLASYTSWHEGLLVFEDESLERIMERLSLWYDVEVNYTDEGIRRQTFTGYLKRYDRIDVILKALQRTISVHFILEGKKLTLMK